MVKFSEFNFLEKKTLGLLIVAGGFEDRSRTFISKLNQKFHKVENVIIFKYTTQKEDNLPNYKYLYNKVKELHCATLQTIEIDGDRPIGCLKVIQQQILLLNKKVKSKTVFIDISGMPHLIALGTIHHCYQQSLKTYVVYTEAKNYFPLKKDWKKLVKAWHSGNYDVTQRYLLSAALKNIHILPEFGGIFRPSHLTCLIIFAGFEPNRVEGLVDDYAPGRLVVFYGKSPHKFFDWRTKLSKELHKDLFSRWFVREKEISTLKVNTIISALADEYKVLSSEFDISIAPQNSKMQAVAAYLFWLKHPDVQLLFTTPVKFNPSRYSKGSGKTYVLKMNN